MSNFSKVNNFREREKPLPFRACFCSYMEIVEEGGTLSEMHLMMCKMRTQISESMEMMPVKTDSGPSKLEGLVLLRHCGP